MIVNVATVSFNHMISRSLVDFINGEKDRFEFRHRNQLARALFNYLIQIFIEVLEWNLPKILFGRHCWKKTKRSLTDCHTASHCISDAIIIYSFNFYKRVACLSCPSFHDLFKVDRIIGRFAQISPQVLFCCRILKLNAVKYIRNPS